MSHILIAHAPEEEGRAALVAEKLSDLGFEVRQDGDGYRALSPLERRKLAASVAEAACVVVLWSRDGLDAPALQGVAQAAKAQGKLALARLDASCPPPRMSSPDIANLAQWQGLDEARGWRDLVEAVTTKTKPTAKTTASTPPKRPAATPTAKSAPAAQSAPTAREKKSGGGIGLALGILVVLAAAGGGAYVYVNHLIPGL